MAIRGEQLRTHILFVAKDVFLEIGFERASMDVIAARAKTSKRTLYAHFENKEKLYLAVIDFVRGVFPAHLKQPGDYSTRPEEAVVLFCARILEISIFYYSVRMARLMIAEAERFPEGSVEYFDVVYTANKRLSAYLKKSFGLSAKESAAAADKLIGQVVYPRFIRSLFGVDQPSKTIIDEKLSPAIDLKPIRKAVADLIRSF